MKRVLRAVAAVTLFCVSLSLSACGENEAELCEWESFLIEYRAAKRDSYRSENEEYADYEVDVAFIGDSLTDGYDVKTSYPDMTVVNRGIGADTTFDLEDRKSVV